MRRVTIIFGLLAGVIISIFLVIIMALCESGRINFDNSDLIAFGGRHAVAHTYVLHRAANLGYHPLLFKVARQISRAALTWYSFQIQRHHVLSVTNVER
jgi:hypothetical protein